MNPALSRKSCLENNLLPLIHQVMKADKNKHGVPFLIKTIRITSKVRLHCNYTRSFRPIAILITNQTKPSIDLTCFDCSRETETALGSLAGNRTRLSSTGLKVIEMDCQEMKSNENEITTHLNGSFIVPFTMTIKTIVISNQDCFDGDWNALKVSNELPRATETGKSKISIIIVVLL